MPNLIVEEVEESELPRRWAEKLGARPGQRFTVTVQSEEERRAAAAELQKLMEAIGKQAQAKGLTPEVAGDILGTDLKSLL